MAEPAQPFGLEIPDWTISVGPSVGGLLDDDSWEPLISMDLTGGTYLFWWSLGMRSSFGQSSYHLWPYVEAGACVVFNVGLGYTMGFGDGEPLSHGIHGFLGLPIANVSLDGLGGHLLFEPYYRPMYVVSSNDEGWAHELGLLVKVIFFVGDNPL